MTAFLREWGIAVERSDYLELCKRYASFRDVRGVVQNPDTEKGLLVSYKGVTAYPLAYRLEYTKTPDIRQVIGGKPVVMHYAILRLKDGLQEMTVPLETVEKWEG